MEKADWHVFQVLTKRSSLMVRYLRRRYGGGAAPAHIWLGVSIEDAQNTVRLKHLADARARTKFVSFEPLIGPVGPMSLGALIGSLSAVKADQRHVLSRKRVLEIRDQCKLDKVAFFFKQWGGPRPKSGGRMLKGREWSQYPDPAKKLLLQAAE